MFERIFVQAMRADSPEGQNLTDRSLTLSPSTNGKTQLLRRRSIWSEQVRIAFFCLKKLVICITYDTEMSPKV